LTTLIFKCARQCNRCGSDFVEVFSSNSAETRTPAATRSSDSGERSMENRLLRHLLGSNLAGSRDIPQGGGGAARGREVHRNIICDGCQMVSVARCARSDFLRHTAPDPPASEFWFLLVVQQSVLGGAPRVCILCSRLYLVITRVCFLSSRVI
jgi:hypothetical protein